ncbi:MAG TPA: MoaD/ThiS family protein [Dissulfurispiraceae bacterium]|nr:MoaD/ThiS family protein [Dissulfurispiraceae bacterium]
MSTAIITIKLFGPLRAKFESDPTLPIRENETIQTVIERLSIEAHPAYLYSLNGRHAKASSQLHDGDVLLIIPPISGG